MKCLVDGGRNVFFIKTEKPAHLFWTYFTNLATDCLMLTVVFILDQKAASKDPNYLVTVKTTRPLKRAVIRCFMPLSSRTYLC